jgi:CheY-like chemotaxis protein
MGKLVRVKRLQKPPHIGSRIAVRKQGMFTVHLVECGSGYRVSVSERQRFSEMVREMTSEVARNPVAQVLLVDDDERQLKLRATIMEVYGYSPLTATGASEARLIAEKERVDIAIVDYDMPVTNGCTLATELKSMDPELKVILLSAAVSVPEAEMSSIDRFVSKGAGVPELLNTISYLLL